MECPGKCPDRTFSAVWLWACFVFCVLSILGVSVCVCVILGVAARRALLTAPQINGPCFFSLDGLCECLFDGLC